MVLDLRTKGKDYFGFILGSIIFTLVFSSASTPVPLFAVYQEALGVSTTVVSLSMGAYLIGVLLTLLFVGRVAQAIGYKAAIFIDLGLAILGCVIFMFLANGPMLLIGRLVQGAACGVAMSAVSAYIIDAIAPYHLGWGTTVSSTFSCFGVMIGSLPAGFLYQTLGSDKPMYLGIILVVVLLAICFAFAPEFIEKRCPLGRVLKPCLNMPSEALPLFALAGFAYIATWCVCNFFQSFSGLMAVENLGTDSTLVAAIILSCATAPTFLGGPIANKTSPLNGLLLGAAVFFVSLAVISVASAIGSLPLLLVFCFLFSISMGICTAAGLRLMLQAAPDAETTDTVSSLNIVAYAGNALFCFGISAVVAWCSFVQILGMYTVCAGILLLWCCLQKRKSGRLGLNL